MNTDGWAERTGFPLEPPLECAPPPPLLPHREILTTLAPRKYPLGTVVGRVSLGTSVVWYQPISFTWYAPTVGSLVLRNRPLLDRRNTFSPGEKGRTTASMAPPIKLEMRSFAARPNVKPPMPPKPIRLDVGN